MSIFKVMCLVPSFFHFSNLLVLKIEICLKYFLDKNLQKQLLCSFGFSFFSFFPRTSSFCFFASRVRRSLCFFFLDVKGSFQ